MSTRSGDDTKTVDEVLADADSRMNKSVEVLNRDLTSLRTGRATPALLENLMVDYYGVSTPLNQIAAVSAPEASLLIVQPWDRQALKDIERSLQKSEMGFNPSNDGTVVRVPIPPLSQDRRKEMVRVLKKKIEDGKVAVRNVRRDALEQLRSMERSKLLSQDDNRRAQDRLQKTTDACIALIDQVSSGKEAEIMQV
ncbi:MAG: ribosome recycling factor [Dehalococcoidia bacterium]|nr:ribosome recycling factor [Dehalococcoidia bacterium]